MDENVRARLKRVNPYLETQDAGYVCRRCGISRPTLRKWFKRYKNDGESGLIELSRKPHSSPNQKIANKHINLVLELWTLRNLGARRIQTELVRLHQESFSLASIHKILINNQAMPIKKLRRKKQFKRYQQRLIPGDRIQMDTCKIALGIYQYTAVDDCSPGNVYALSIPEKHYMRTAGKFVAKNSI